ncbi:hypothetical protein ABTM72_19740, partial [Acinetobacter baumannii]
RYADGLCTRLELAEAQDQAGPAATSKAKTVAFHAASDDSWSAACMAALTASRGSTSIKKIQASILYDLFGNPFRPRSFSTPWLSNQ